MPESPKIIVALVTCPPDRAPALAGALVEARVAACVNIIPAVESVYRWKGAVQHDGEALLVIKTAAGAFEALKQAVLKHHPYELPEVIAVPVEQGHRPYLDWVVESLK
jgi:periplasmic divalent cation tolerance protein